MCDEMCRVKIRSGWVESISDFSFSILELVQIAAILIVAVILFNNNDISKRAWITFFTFSNLVMGHCTNLVALWHNAKTVQGTLDKVGNIMDTPNESSGTESASELRGDIIVKDLTFGYIDEEPVFERFNATFEKGKITGLLGVSGCGKTTLVNLIDRIYLPSEGTVEINGRNVNDFEMDSYRRLFSITSQNVMLFSGTIKENLLFNTQRTFTDEELMQVLEHVELSEYIAGLPDGLNTQIGEYGNRLSGGQKQKIALARLFLADTPYLILDEATASMDVISVSGIRKFLSDFAKDKTVIIIAHSANMAPLFDNVVVIENGKASGQGEFQKVLEENTFLRHFMNGGAANV